MKILLWFVWLVLLAVLGLLLLWLRTYWLEQSADDRRFSEGTVEGVSLDGVYRGSAAVTGSWVGKRIVGAESRGVNVFEKDGEQSEQYPFALSVTKGLRDEHKDVIRLDYDQPGNPWWLRLITDEMVQVGEGEYLGKVHVRVIPGLPLTVGFFTLEQ